MIRITVTFGNHWGERPIIYEFEEHHITEVAADLNRGSLDLMQWIVEEAVHGNMTKSYALGLAVMETAKALKRP